jgi:hypothetical protein
MSKILKDRKTGKFDKFCFSFCLSNLLNKVQKVQESDTTGDATSYADGSQKIFKSFTQIEISHAV